MSLGQPGKEQGLLGLLGTGILLPNELPELVAKDIKDLLHIADLPVAHTPHLRLGARKAPTGLLPQRPFGILFCKYIILQDGV